MNDSKEKLAALIHKQCALISIDTGYACAGVELDESGYVYKTAPIFKWMMHKSLREIKRWKNIKKIEVASTFDYDMSDKAYNPD